MKCCLNFFFVSPNFTSLNPVLQTFTSWSTWKKINKIYQNNKQTKLGTS